MTFPAYLPRSMASLNNCVGDMIGLLKVNGLLDELLDEVSIEHWGTFHRMRGAIALGLSSGDVADASTPTKVDQARIESAGIPLWKWTNDYAKNSALIQR